MGPPRGRLVLHFMTVVLMSGLGTFGSGSLDDAWDMTYEEAETAGVPLPMLTIEYEYTAWAEHRGLSLNPDIHPTPGQPHDLARAFCQSERGARRC